MIRKFGTKAVHSGTNPVGGGVNTPMYSYLRHIISLRIRYAGWAAGALNTHSSIVPIVKCKLGSGSTAKLRGVRRRRRW